MLIVHAAAEVVNAAVLGWSSQESLIALHLFDLDLQPDVVVVHLGLDDLRDGSAPDLLRSHLQRLAEERLRQEWVTFKADDQKRWTGYTLSQDEAIRELRQAVEEIVDILDGKIPPPRPSAEAD